MYHKFKHCALAMHVYLFVFLYLFELICLLVCLCMQALERPYGHTLLMKNMGNWFIERYTSLGAILLRTGLVISISCLSEFTPEIYLKIQISSKKALCKSRIWMRQVELCYNKTIIYIFEQSQFSRKIFAVLKWLASTILPLNWPIVNSRHPCLW